MQVLQSRVDRYIKAQNKRNDVMDQILPSLLDLRMRLQQDSEKLLMISDMRNKMQSTANYSSSISNEKVQPASSGSNGNSHNTIGIVLGVIAILVSLAAIMGIKF